MAAKNRESNFELLRIVAMILIIAYHLTAHGVLYQLDDSVYSNPVFYNRLFIFQVIMSFGSIANASFFLISGYYMAGREGKTVDLTKIGKRLILQLVFGAVILSLGSMIFYKIQGSKIPTPVNLIDIRYVNDWVWFIGYYFIVIVIGAIFLNDSLRKMDRDHYRRLLVVLFLIVSLLFTSKLLENLMDNLNIVAGGIFFYALGGYIRKYNPFEKLRAWVLAAIPVAILALLYLSYYNNTTTKIAQYLEDVGIRQLAGSGIDTFKQPVFGITDTGIITIVMAVTIFEITRRINIGSIKPINYIARTTFMIYIIHDNEFWYDIWGLTKWVDMFYYTPRIFAVNYLKWIAIMFVIGAASYLLYALTCKACNKLKFLAVRRL